MFSELEPLADYRPFGVEWPDDIPAHWEVRRIQSAVDMRVSNVDKHVRDGDVPVQMCNYVDVYRNDRITKNIPFMQSTATTDEIKRFQMKPGDVLITKDSEAWDDIGVPALVENSAEGVVCGYHLALLRPSKTSLNGAYLFRTLQCSTIACQFHMAANGVIRYGLSHHAIKSALLPIPPLAEQIAIVNYLDHVDQRIHRYIDGKQRLIALLEEQRQAVVHRAVTRGLDPNVRFKSSVVEWNDNIPTHWSVRKIRHCGTISGGMTPSMENRRLWDGVIPWVTPKDMKKAIVNDSILHVSKAAINETALKIIPPPAVLLVVRGMILAKKVPICYTTTEVTINQDMKAIVPNAGVDAKFLSLSMTALQTNFVPLIDEAGHGTRRLPTERWRELTLPLPSLTEQVAIVEYLDKATADIDAAIDRTHREIELMREYRERLIADVVTGKLDVREAAEQLPEPGEKADEPPPSGETEAHTEDGRRVSDHVVPSSEVTGA